MKGPNRLINPDFEEQGNIIINSRYFPNNWLPTGTLSGDTSLGIKITTLYAYTFDRSFEMEKTGSNNTGMYQTVDFGYDISGLTFDIGMWIRVTIQTGDSGVKLSYKWLDSSGTIIGSQVTIASLTATQAYTLHSVSGVTAPSNAQKIWLNITTIGSNQPMEAFVDSPYIYGGNTYGLKIYNTDGDSNTVLPEASSIIASGTISMSNTLQDDKTYGVDIDLPGGEYIDTDKIGVMVQARDFDWKAKVNILTYDSGNKFWGNFFGDSGTVPDPVTYYEKASDGVMTEWKAGAMTPGTQSTYNFLIRVSPTAIWETEATSIKKIRLFAGIDYTFLKTIAGGSTTYTLYARDYGNSALGGIGYMLSTSDGSIEKTGTVTSPIGYTIHWSTQSDFDVYVLHSNGSLTSLGTGVASSTFSDRWGGAGSRTTTQSATWACPGYGSWTSTDALYIKMNIDLKANSWPLGQSQYNQPGSVIFITPQLGWSGLNATTWTMSRYLVVGQMWQNNGVVTANYIWGTSAKPLTISNISAGYSASTAQQVYSIGDNGISEVDYMIYLKDYNGS